MLGYKVSALLSSLPQAICKRYLPTGPLLPLSPTVQASFAASIVPIITYFGLPHRLHRRFVGVTLAKSDLVHDTSKAGRRDEICRTENGAVQRAMFKDFIGGCNSSNLSAL